jgi:hypothetical protein
MMKVILFVALILSGMMSAGGQSSDVIPSHSPAAMPEIGYAGSVAREQAAVATPVVQATQIASGAEGDAGAVTAAIAETPDPARGAASTADAEPVLLRSVEELTLYDDRAAVIGKLGEPQGVTQDDFYSELAIYEYERLKVVFFGEYIQSIDIAADVEEVLLDDRYVATTLADLKEALGEPDYVAEDGIVFQRGEALLKLFLDEASGELSSISYYHIATV